MMNSNKKIHFEISERKLLLKIFDIVVVFVALYLVSAILKFDYFNFSKANFYWIFVLSLYLNIFGSVFEMYNLQTASTTFPIVRSIVLTTSTTVLVYLLTPIYSPVLPKSRLQIILFFVAIFASLVLWRIFYVKFLASKRFAKNAVLICDSDQLNELISEIEKADPHYKFLAFLNSDAQTTENNFKIQNLKISDLQQFVSQNSISEVVIASQKTEGITVEIYNQLLHLLENGFTIREYTQVYEEITQRIPVQYVSRDFYRYFPFSRNNQNQLYLLIVAFLEILFSLTGLLLGCLLLPFILVGNALANKGKLFYTQERVGKNGIVFKIFKLRTMIANAEKEGAVFASNNDVRITAFGKFLRKTRIDEVPQFLNILRGEMAIIGPRPERPIFVSEIAKMMPFYETRHVVKPGITGWAQVNYAYGDSINDSLIKLQYDLYYIKHRSLFLDLSISIKTLSTVLFYRGQ